MVGIGYYVWRWWRQCIWWFWRSQWFWWSLGGGGSDVDGLVQWWCLWSWYLSDDGFVGSNGGEGMLDLVVAVVAKGMLVVVISMHGKVGVILLAMMMVVATMVVV